MNPTNKRWRLRDFPHAGFARELGLPPFHSHLLYNRGIRSAAATDLFLNADRRLSHDARLLPDVDAAVARIRRALDDQERISIFGDFDADGITGTALLTTALGELGAQVLPYIPDRVDEGHGLNPAAIRKLRKDGVSLLITVDCGATSISEVDTASSLGIDTIITDHHSLLPALPDCVALINPKHPESRYPFGELTGVGMSFKLIEALYDALGLPWPEHLLEFVAMGTVADVGPLTGENRFFVKRGLEHINRTQNLGIRAIAGNSRLTFGTIDTEALSFKILPRLNVAGRLGSAHISLDLLMAQRADAARSIANRIESMNRHRQELTRNALAEADQQIAEQRNAYSAAPPHMLIVKSANWIPGVLGLIAGRLSDQFYRPSVAIALGEARSRASARSIPQFNIIAALRHSAPLFERYGGHPQAAGFTIPNDALPSLEDNLQRIAADQLENRDDLAPSIDIDCEVQFAAFTPPQMAFIQSLEPFGEGNPAPVFLTRGVQTLEARRVGAQRQHLKLRMRHGGITIDAIGFNLGERISETRADLDLVYTIGMNTWNGRSYRQLTVQDFRRSRTPASS